MSAAQLNALLPWVIVVVWPLVLIAETLAPLRRFEPRARVRHLGRNLGVVAAGFIVNFAVGPTMAAVAVWAHARGYGLLAVLGLPFWADTVLGVLLADGVDYFRHRLHHGCGPLWRLHRVHHLDEAVDSSTGLLNHPLESVPMLAAYLAAIVVLGVSPVALALRVLAGMAALLFHHSNFALPEGLDRALSQVTPTPRTHRVHHARHPPLTDSNFGTVFTFWDRLFGTWRTLPDVAQLDTGLDDYGAQTVGGMLAHPFSPLARRPRPPAGGWRAPRP